MPKSRKSKKSGRTSPTVSRAEEVSISLRLPADLNERLAELQALQECCSLEGSGAKEINARLRLPEGVARELIWLQSHLSMKHDAWMSRNAMIVEVVEDHVRRIYNEALRTLDSIFPGAHESAVYSAIGVLDVVARQRQWLEKNAMGNETPRGRLIAGLLGVELNGTPRRRSRPSHVAMTLPVTVSSKLDDLERIYAQGGAKFDRKAPEPVLVKFPERLKAELPSASSELVTVVRRRASAFAEEIASAFSSKRRYVWSAIVIEQLSARLRKSLSSDNPGDKVSRNAMIVRMLHDRIKKERHD